MIGQEIGNYVLEAELGKGGMGEVYLGRHKSLGRKAAIKVMSPAFSNDPRLAERFSREARTQAQLQHPHIAQVLDHLEHDGRWFLIIQYMEGGTLEDVLAKRAGLLPVPQALAWAKQALHGLDYAHRNGVVHRDVKPANILINDRGEAAVTDFGIAIEVGAQRLTSTGASIGTPEYMSPEQIRGVADLDHRTDVYSMGVVLYQLLSGRVPFEALSTFEVQRAQVSEPPPPLRQVNPAVSPELEALVMKPLAKDPADRFTSCGELARAIEAYERGESVAMPLLRHRQTVIEPPRAPMFPSPAEAPMSPLRSPTVMASAGPRTAPPLMPAKKGTPTWWIAAGALAALAAGAFWATRFNETEVEPEKTPPTAEASLHQETTGEVEGVPQTQTPRTTASDTAPVRPVAMPARPAGVTTATPSRDLRYTVMVSKFENRSGSAGQWDIGSSCSTSLTNKLYETGRFIVVAENDMRAEAMSEQARGASGVTSQGNKTPTMGQMTPAQLLVKGVITHFQHEVSKKGSRFSYKGFGVGTKKKAAEINITIEMVDSATGVVVASKSVIGRSEQSKKTVQLRTGDVQASHDAIDNDNVRTAIDDAIGDAVKWMVPQLDSIPWRGTVVLVEKGLVYINRGRREGVTEGLTFTVGETEVLRDPDTGRMLDQFVKERGRIRAVRVDEKTTVCQIEKGSDIGAIYKGMGVMPAS